MSKGKAAPNYDNPLDGEKIIETAIKSFKRIDVLINNFDINCSEKSLLEIEDSSWDSLIQTTLAGMFKVRRTNRLRLAEDSSMYVNKIVYKSCLVIFQSPRLRQDHKLCISCWYSRQRERFAVKFVSLILILLL